MEAPTTISRRLIAPFRDAAQEGSEKPQHPRLVLRRRHAGREVGDVGHARCRSAGGYGTANRPARSRTTAKAIEPFYAKDNNVQYAAVMSRLPGEAEHERAFFAVFTPRPSEATFGGAVSAAKGELGGGFPWLAVGLIFVIGSAAASRS